MEHVRYWVIVAAGLISLGAAGLQAEEGPSAIRKPFQYDAKGHRDPFAPLVRDGRLVGARGSSIDASQAVLHGILWDPGGHSIAMVDDAEVKVGDMVGDYEVVEIRQDAVVLKGGAESLVLRIDFERPSEGRSSRTTKGGDGP
ncbi:MAG: hypothetical protein HYY59_05810 [Candidatus Omnitrophica bacterium]|nr:hypothetical protein [Candidatus Omnitrophota bacterium]MBI3021495.1 hypothetical protein [Candidatus Omnitrophota bacterium]